MCSPKPTEIVGYGFRPTDEELVDFYLKHKLLRDDPRVHVLTDIDLCDVEPWEVPAMLAKSEIQFKDPEWFFFSPVDFKYSNSKRFNRRTKCGFWKPTGKDRDVKTWDTNTVIGTKKTLVFHNGCASKGVKANWVIHEYHALNFHQNQKAFVLCRLIKKPGKITEGNTDAAICGEGESSINLVSAYENQTTAERVPSGGTFTGMETICEATDQADKGILPIEASIVDVEQYETSFPNSSSIDAYFRNENNIIKIPSKNMLIAYDKIQILNENSQVPNQNLQTPLRNSQTPSENICNTSKRILIPFEITDISNGNSQTPNQITPFSYEITPFSCENLQTLFRNTQNPYEISPISCENSQTPFKSIQNPSEITKMASQITRISSEIAPISCENLQTPFESTQNPYVSTQIPYEITQNPYENSQTSFQNIQIPFDNTQISYEKFQTSFENNPIPFQITQNPYEIIQTSFGITQIPNEDSQTPFENNSIESKTTQIPYENSQTSSETVQLSFETMQTPFETIQKEELSNSHESLIIDEENMFSFLNCFTQSESLKRACYESTCIDAEVAPKPDANIEDIPTMCTEYLHSDKYHSSKRIKTSYDIGHGDTCLEFSNQVANQEIQESRFQDDFWEVETSCYDSATNKPFGDQ